MRGCLEAYCSATAAMARAAELGLQGSLAELAAAARMGAAREAKLFEDLGEDLGLGLGTLQTLYEPELFLIGGGLGKSVELMQAGIRRGIAQADFLGRDIPVRAATLGNAAGWVGAALLHTCP
ncbi:MAG: ROK family protein [Planctomycetota bacterium]